MRYTPIATFLFLLFTINSALGYPYFHYDQKKINLRQSSFTRYVLPQLRSINQEFYSILKKVEPLVQEIILIKKNVSTMKRSWEVGKESCAMSSNCDKLLSQLRKRSLNLERKIFLFQKNKLTGKVVKSRHVVSRFLSVSESIDGVSLRNFRLLHKLENSIIDGIDQDLLHHERFDKFSITNLLKEMAFYAEDMMIGVVGDKYRPLFEQLWCSFVNPIEDHVLTRGNQKYLIRNLGDLNMGWSAFHMQMERGNLNVPNNIIVTINVMRQRWNSVLKMYLKHTEFLDTKEKKK
ncbi:MAG: hypothetical protein KAG61_03340 [Bacteriovoracaceae bacterium]|nr:hypothetical protein [Bacteriovoracaceae bacterium]